jgi:hypothetical protein
MLYLAQGGNTNRGAPSHHFNYMPEFAYSAIVRIDLDAIGETTYDLPTLKSDLYPNLTGPFGGDFGRRQAKIVPGSPVQVHAPGFRNPYDLASAAVSCAVTASTLLLQLPAGSTQAAARSATGPTTRPARQRRD